MDVKNVELDLDTVRLWAHKFTRSWMADIHECLNVLDLDTVDFKHEWFMV